MHKNSLNLSTMWLSYLDLASLPGLTTGETHYYTISSQLVSIVQLSLRISCNITQLSLPQNARCWSLPPQCLTLPSEPSDGPHLLLHSFLPPQTCYMSIIVISLNSEEWRIIQFSCVQRIIHISAKPYNAKTVVAIMHYVFCVANCMQTVDTSVGCWHSICTRLTLRQKCRMTSWVEGGLHNP